MLMGKFGVTVSVKKCEQYRFLGPAARARYQAKLLVLGLKEADDPFAVWNDNKFNNRWVFGNLFSTHTFFAIFWSILGCSYTRQELMQWKSLEMCNYFENGQVYTVEIWPVDSTSCILRESVHCSSQLQRPCGDYQEIDGWDSLWLSGYNSCYKSKRCTGTQCWAKSTQWKGYLPSSAQVSEA